MRIVDAIMTVASSVIAILYVGRGAFMSMGICESISPAPHLQYIGLGLAALFVATQSARGWRID